MIFTETTLAGAYIIDLERREDERGHFARAFCQNEFTEHGLNPTIAQANVAYKAPLGRGLLIEGGIFLSPVGPEGMAIKDQWNWSRSNLFFGLPFYHTGLKVSYAFTDRLFTNGWLWAAVAACLVLQVAADYAPFLQTVLRTTPLTGGDWAVVLACSLAPVGMVELVKLGQRVSGPRP